MYLLLHEDMISIRCIFRCDGLPSIEYWFLLHYEDTNRFFPNSDSAENALHKHIVNYDKTDSFLSNRKWVEGMTKDGKLLNAIERARRYEDSELSYSNVFKAIDFLSNSK